MNKSLIICDRVMYGALLLMVFFLPYSLALIEIFQVTMMLAWALKRFLLCKTPVRQGHTQGFNFFSSSMGWSLMAIALLIVLTIPFSHYPALSIRKFFTRFVQQIFLMYLVTQIIHSRQRLYSVLSVLLATLFFVTIDVMVQFTWGKSIVCHAPLIYGRVSAPMNHPNDLGTLLVTVLPVVLISIITCRNWIPLLLDFSKPLGAWIPWAGAVVISLLFFLLVSALGLTASRGAWVAFVLSMVTLGACLKNRKVAMILIILVLGVFLWAFDIHSLNTRSDIYSAHSNAVGSFFSLDGRDFYWATATGVIKHYPWFGCGYSAYVQTLRDLHVSHQEYPHNSLLHITAELGIVGLILYGWFFTALCLQIKNTLSVVSREHDLFLFGCGISSGILAWMIHSLMDTAWGSLQLSVLWWLFIGILLSLGFIQPKGEKLCQ